MKSHKANKKNPQRLEDDINKIAQKKSKNDWEA